VTTTGKTSPFPSAFRITDEDNVFIPDNPAEFMRAEIEELGLNVDLVEPQLSKIERLAAGGMGEIFTARDDTLGRVIAVKTLKPENQYSLDQIERIVREAKATAQLEHPNIVPIHSIGASPSKGIYFTMKRLRGDSLRHIITQMSQRNPAYTKVYTFHMRMSIFQKICQGISYAHSKGIIHRDLKPENILVGNYGEVTIIDWGLVKKMDSSYSSHVPTMQSPIEVYEMNDQGGFEDDAPYSQSMDTAMDAAAVNLPICNLTRDGQLNGTPRFMSPEQIFGDVEAIDTRTDIYSLGIILYELLTFTNPFSDKHEENEILNAVSRGQYRRPRQTAFGRDIPPELEAICLKAMNMNKESRYKAVNELLKDLIAHQEGLRVMAYRAPYWRRMIKFFKRNPIKTAIVFSGLVALLTFISANYIVYSYYYNLTMRQVHLSVASGEFKLDALSKRLNDEQEARLAAERRGEEGQEIIGQERYEATMTEIDNHFNEASLLLSSMAGLRNSRQDIHQWRERIMKRRIKFCLEHGKLNELRKLRGLLAANFGDNLERSSEEMSGLIAEMEVALAGQCTLEVQTTPPGAALEIAPLVMDADGTQLGSGSPVNFELLYSPLRGLRLPKGTYLIKMQLEGIPELVCPVTLKHGEQKSVWYDLPKAIPAGTAYVPGGICLIGGKASPYRRELEVDVKPFFISLYEVTNGEYLEFWLSLDGVREREEYISRVILTAGSNVAFAAWDGSGKLLPELKREHPVVGISREAAEAYCQWLGRKLHRPCRLPTVEEWEKAARGTDGRPYPWGYSFVSSYVFTHENEDALREYGRWAPPGSFPADISPYGVFDMAGNVREWTASEFPDASDTFFQIKGASSSTPRRYLPLECSDDTAVAPSDVGFRYVLPYLDTDTAQD
jgi:serine/threonine protein kinase/formylglycine-generating enzyme required for sulfatase activity